MLGRFDQRRRRVPAGRAGHRGCRASGCSTSSASTAISLWLVLLTTFLFPIVGAGVVDGDDRTSGCYMISMLVLETAVLGSFLALDLLAVLRLLRGAARSDVPDHRRVGRRAAHVRGRSSSSCTRWPARRSCWSAILFLYARRTGRRGTFDLRTLADAAATLPVQTARWLFLAFFVAFAVKVPLFPLHTWLPDAHTEAPTAGSVLLAGVLLKVGAYGLIRFNLALFPEASKHFATPIVGAGGDRHHLRRGVRADPDATSSGWSRTPACRTSGSSCWGSSRSPQQAVTGGVLQMVNHGLATGALFLLVGMVYDRTHTRRLDEMGGLASRDAVAARVLPVRGVRLRRAAGAQQLRRRVPGDRRDVRGEPLVRRRSPRSRWCSARSTCCGPTSGWRTARSTRSTARCRDVSAREVLVIVPVLALLLVFGVYPKLLTDSIDPATTQVVEHVAPDHATTVVPAIQVAAARGAADDRARCTARAGGPPSVPRRPARTRRSRRRCSCSSRSCPS